MADDSGDTLDVAALTALPDFSKVTPFTPGPAATTSRQQAVIQQVGGAPNTTPILPDSNSVNVSNIIGSALSDYQNASRQLMQGGDFGIGSAFKKQMDALQEQSMVLQQKVALDFATKRRIEQLDAADRARFGITGDGGSGTMANLASAVQTQEALRQGIAADVSKKLSVNFFDNPLEYIKNRFVLPSEISQLEIAEGNVAQNLTVMKNLQELMDKRHADNVIAATDTSVAAELNARQQIAVLSQIELSKVAVEASKNALSVANIRTATSKGVFDALREANNLDNQNVSNALSFQHLGLQEAQQQQEQIKIGQQQQINDLTIADKEKKAEAEAKLQLGLDAAIRLGTLPTGTDVKLLQLMPTAQREFALSMASNALTGGGAYGFNIADSIDKAGASPFPVPVGTAGLLQRLGPKVVEVENDNGSDIIFKQKPKNVQNIIMNEGLKTKLNSEVKSIPDENGVFSPGTALSVAAIPILQNNPVMKQVAVMATGNTSYALKSQDVLAAAATLINNKQITRDQAIASINQIYQSVILDNNQRFMYNRLGIPGLDEIGTGFNSKVKLGAFGSATTVNMVNPAAVGDALTRTLVRASAAEQESIEQTNTRLQGIQ